MKVVGLGIESQTTQQGKMTKVFSDEVFSGHPIGQSCLAYRLGHSNDKKYSRIFMGNHLMLSTVYKLVSSARIVQSLLGRYPTVLVHM